MALRRRKPCINQPIAQSFEHSEKIPEVPEIEKEVINMSNFATPVQSISNPGTEMINRRMMQKISKASFYPDPTYIPPPKPVRIPMSEVPENIDINPALNTDFEEKSPLKEGVISETYQRPDNYFFQESQ